ncbi:MAG: hypothetical protein MUF03_11585 [Rubrivivax sp.]|jgi:hypothetical protein|nr:hypothetical protein [Rubrivivax sp.]
MRLAVALAIAALIGACAILGPADLAPGRTETEVVQRLGMPTARYPLDGGATRIEWATGPFGRSTWMVDFDASGRSTAARQVLTESNLMAFQVRAPGLTRAELLRELGTPGEVRGARGGGQTWSWRYQTNDCLWFQVSLDAAGIVTSGAFGIDWACDAGWRRGF